MALDLTQPLPYGSYAWCGDCPWRSDAGWAHRDAKAHGEVHEHVTHVWTADENCHERHNSAFGQVFRCELHRLHGESHRARTPSGADIVWPNSPVDKPVEAGG